MKKTFKTLGLACLLLCLTVCFGLFTAACNPDGNGDKNFTVTVMKDATTPAEGVTVVLCASDGEGNSLTGVNTDANGKAVIDYSTLTDATKAYIYLSNLPADYVYANASGTAYGNEEGVEVTLSTNAHTVTLTKVTGGPVTGITLDPTSTVLATGATANIIATVAPENATDKTLTWDSSNKSVATVETTYEGCVVTGVAEGTSTITATSANGVHAECTVTVKTAGSEADVAILVNFTDNEANVTANVEAGKTVYYYFNNYAMGMNPLKKWVITSENTNAKITYNTVDYIEDEGTVTVPVNEQGVIAFAVTTVDGSAATINFTVAEVVKEPVVVTVVIGTASDVEVEWESSNFGPTNNTTIKFHVEDEGIYKITVSWTGNDDVYLEDVNTTGGDFVQLQDQSEMGDVPYWAIIGNADTPVQAGDYTFVLASGIFSGYGADSTRTYNVLIEKVVA